MRYCRRFWKFYFDLTLPRINAADLWSFDDTEAYPLGEVIIPGLQPSICYSGMEENKWVTMPEGLTTFPERGRCARFARDEVIGNKQE
jgi:hypothetical protein